MMPYTQMPNYYMPSNMAQNVYQPSYERYSQPQYQPQNMIGRMVDDFNSITANDVPMDGSPATFIKRDMSEVQLRCWTPNGTISTSIFKPVLEPNNSNSTNSQVSEFESLNGEIQAFKDEILSRFDKLEKSMGAKPTTSRKKEVSDDE